MRAHYEKMIRDNDRRVKISLRIQNMDAQSEFCGGFPDADRLYDVRHTLYRVKSMTAAYCNEKSVYFQSELLEERILAGLSFAERNQHEDGLFDLIKCNFHSAPDTAFSMKELLPCLYWFRNRQRDERQNRIYEKMYGLTRRTADGLLCGGFHTPNHRWVIASSLMVSADFFQNPEYSKAAERYLAEGIDCNEDGEYA